MKKLLLALALFLLPSLAWAQCNGVFPNNTVCGNITGTNNTPRAVPSSSLPGLGLVVGTTTISGGTTGPLLNVSGLLQNPSNLANTYIAPGAANTFKGSLNGTATSDIALTACTLTYQITKWVAGTGWQCGINPVLPSRAIAATLNLSAFSAITTQGYATPGDGGGATFQNVGSTAFKDTYVTTFSITTTGSGLTNASYLGVSLTGGSSAGCSGSAVVAGNVLSSIAFTMYCSGYKVGDVLAIPTSFIGGSGVAPTVTVTAISTPQASFTDTAGTHFQYVTDQTGIANILQFGAKGDWNGTDGTATNNLAAAWSAASWANNQYTAVISGAGSGSQVLWPKGAYMVCGNWNASQFVIPIPQYTRFSGAGGTGSAAIVECAANSSNLFLFALCDSSSFFGQYGCKLENLMIDSQQITTATAGTAAIYSNSGQQFVLGENLEIQPGLRGCIKYEIGKGGASNDIWKGIDCEQSSGAGNPGFSFNASSTQHYLLHSVIGSNGSGASAAISNSNGRLIVDGLEIENYSSGLTQNVSTSGNISVYRNVQQNSNNCTAAVTLLFGNVPGNLLLENVATTCPVTVLNGQSGGTNFTGNIVKPITCVSGACS